MFLLEPFIQRDGYERYLLMHKFISEISKQWSLFLFCALFLSLGSTVLTYYLLISTKQLNWGFILALAVEALFFIYPVACLGYANKHVGNILRNFRLTSPDDYELLGSRDKWVEFTSKCPLYWHIMGIPITKNVLTAYYTTAGTVAPAVLAVLTVFSSAVGN